MYGDVSRLVFKKEYAKDHVSFGLYENIVKHCLKLGLDYIFVITSSRHMRRYRYVFQDRLSVNFAFRDDVRIPSSSHYKEDVECKA